MDALAIAHSHTFTLAGLLHQRRFSGELSEPTDQPIVSSRSAAYRWRTCGAGSAVYSAADPAAATRAPRPRRTPPRRPAARRRAPRTRPALGHGHRHAEDRRGDGADRRGPGGAADQDHPLRGDPAGREVVDGVRQRAEHGLDRGPREVRRRGVAAGQATQHAVRVGPVRAALAVQVGQQRQARRPRARRPAPGRRARPRRCRAGGP